MDHEVEDRLLCRAKVGRLIERLPRRVGPTPGAHGPGRDGRIVHRRRLAALAALLIPFAIPSAQASALPIAAGASTELQEPPTISRDVIEDLYGEARYSGLVRIEVDFTELERVGRLYERDTTELAGITIDLRRRVSSDLLDAVAVDGLPTGLSERITEEVAAHVGELERFTLDLERLWAGATLTRSGL